MTPAAQAEAYYSEECVEEVNCLARQIAEITDEIEPLQEGEA